MKKLLPLILLLVSCSPLRELPPRPTVTPTPTATTTATETTPTEPAPMQCAVTAKALHIRSGAGAENPVTGYLYAGDIVTIQNQRGAWYDITSPSGIGDGWIHSNYCERK